MFEPLVAYAKTHLPGAEPGFAPKYVRWAIICDEQGLFLGVTELGDAEQKKNPGRKFEKCPELSQPELIKGGVTRSHFLVDSASVVVLFDALDKKTAKKHAFFKYLLAQAGETAPVLGLCSGILESPADLERIRAVLKEKKAKPIDKITFRIGTVYPLEISVWHEWWREYRKNFAVEDNKGGKASPTAKSNREKSASALMPCFVTGKLCDAVKTHPKIGGLADVGGQPSGCSLIGFDKESFRSFGFEQSVNAAVSEQGANFYRSALNELISTSSYRLAQTKVVYWFKEKIPQEDDLIFLLIEGKDREERDALELAGELLNAAKAGKKIHLAGNIYYALTLSGAGGRVMVRDWMQGSFEQLAENIAEWFDDLSIVHRSGGGLAKSPKLMAVGGATVRDLDDLPAPLATGLWRSALTGGAIPVSALAGALNRARISVISDEPANHAGIGLIKAYHLRKHRSRGGEKMDEVKPYLNEYHPHPAYHCGRIMAFFAAIQRSALGDVGAGVIQRYYAAASATPALVLGRLARTSQFHLNKLDAGLAYWYEGKIADIWARIADSVPATLNLEEQSLFALGYYQQTAARRLGNSQNTDENKENAYA